jgi:transglutaminase-like putative cysteine protease
MTICTTHKRLRLRYSSSVTQCARRFRVFPTEQRGTQRVLYLKWNCTPPADIVRETRDEFGNCVLELFHQRITRDFNLEVSLRSAREDMNCNKNEGVPEVGLGAFLLPSSLCDAGEEIVRVAEKLRPQLCNEALSDAAFLNEWTHKAIEYSTVATTPVTTASQSLKLGAGVCQDYAHVMIALCRSLGIAARYVSGYIPGEGAMHAWVEVLSGEQWHAFDPTHARPTLPDCVFVACGRDFRDVSPVRGAYSGNAVVQMQVWCETKSGA